MYIHVLFSEEKNPPSSMNSMNAIIVMISLKRLKYDCDQYGISFTHMGNLDTQKKSHHGGVMYVMIL